MLGGSGVQLVESFRTIFSVEHAPIVAEAKTMTIHTPPDFFPTVIIGAHQSAVSPAGTGLMIPILTAAFSSSWAKFLNETGMLYGVMTFVGLAFGDIVICHSVGDR